MFYSEDIIEQVRSENNIVDVIGDYVKLQKKGSSYFGLCPFHNEKSPSFSVSPHKQMYYCFGCGEGGNVISFLMKYENYTFVEALEVLANRAGIELPKMEYSKEARQEKDLKSKIIEINTEAAGSIVTQPDEAVADAKSDLSEIENNAAVETVTPEKKEMEMEKEIQEQTLDMERLNDLLSDVYRKAEFCTAFLYSDKNKCRNLLKEMKKELKKYAEEIAGM